MLVLCDDSGSMLEAQSQAAAESVRTCRPKMTGGRLAWVFVLIGELALLRAAFALIGGRRRLNERALHRRLRTLALQHARDCSLAAERVYTLTALGVGAEQTPQARGS